MRHALLLLAGIVLVSGAAWAQAPQVTQVRAQQFGSFVRIEYDLSGPADTPIAVSLAASNDGGQLFSLPLSEVHGDVGVHLSPGTGKVAIWDAGTDLPDSINPDVRIWVKAWIPNAAPVALDNTDFVFVYADGPDTGGTVRETQLPGFYVTPCRISQSANPPAVPQSLVDSYPDFAFEVFQDQVSGETWDDIRAHTPWIGKATANCTWETGWRIAAYYWPSEINAPITPSSIARPWALADASATSASFTLDTTIDLRDVDGDGVADDKTDDDQNGIVDAYQDFDNDGIADAFEDNDHNGIADAYVQAGAGEAALAGFADGNGNQLPDFFESRYPITSSTHPLGERVYFNGSFSATIRGYQPGAAGYRWRITDEDATTLDSSDTALNGALPQTVTAEPGDGIHYLHVAAIDGAGGVIAGSERRFVFNTSLQAPTVSSETHAAPENASQGRVFAARIQVPYGPKQWRTETGDSRAGHSLLAFQGGLWIVQPDGGVWRSRDGFSWETETLTAPWAGAQFLSAVVFQQKLWVYGSSTKTSGEGLQAQGALWTSPDGRHWTKYTGAPWTDREQPTLTVFRESLYVFGGISYAPLLGPRTTTSIWRTSDAIQWDKLANDVAWSPQNAPVVCVFGDGLWMNNYPENPLREAATDIAWRSWDGTNWVPVTTPLEDAGDLVELLLPAEGAWLGWENAYWRYYAYPWTGQLTPFRESLWYAGAAPVENASFKDTGDIWWYDGDRVFSRAVEHFDVPVTGAKKAISFRGRIQPISTVTINSEYGDRWYGSGIYRLGGNPAVFRGSLWCAWQYLFVLRVPFLEYANIHDMFDGAGLLSFDNQLWRIGYRGSRYTSDSPSVMKSVDGFTWANATEIAPWGYRYDAGCVVHDGAMWLLGGASDVDLVYVPGEGYYRSKKFSLHNDVWRSPDGVNWTEVSAASPWTPRQMDSAVSYDGNIWMLGGLGPKGMQYSDLWHTTDGVDWEQDTVGMPPGAMAGALVTHQDSLFLMAFNADGRTRPVRRYGQAYTPVDSLQGIRYVIDTLPDTIPSDQSPIDPHTFLVTEPMTPGSYWLHLTAVDSLGQSSAVVHRSFVIKPTPAPSIVIEPAPNAAGIPANQISATIAGMESNSETGALYYGLNLEPGGPANVATGETPFSLPCLAAGTYWLVSQSTDQYGFLSARNEQQITVLPEEVVPAPSIHLPLAPYVNEEFTGRDPGDVQVQITPAIFTENEIPYVVDQRLGFPADYSDGFATSTPDFSLSVLNPGRYFLHAHTIDNCGAPSLEAVRSFFVRKRYAPIIKMDPSATLDTVVLTWDAIELEGIQYRYVVDTAPDTVPTLDSDATSMNGLSFPVPEGPWEQYVHVCVEDASGILSDAGHYQLAGDADNYIGIRGPQLEYVNTQPVTYYIAAPTLHFMNIQQNQVSVLPSMEGVSVQPTYLTTLGSEAQVRLYRDTEGPIALVLPQGSLSGMDRDVSPTTTRYIDRTGPGMSIEATVVPAGPVDELRFTLLAPDAEDLYLNAQVLHLVAYPDVALDVTPEIKFENGIWEITYAGVDLTQETVRLIVDERYSGNSTHCVGHDRAGNCIGTATSSWIGDASSALELAVVEPSKLILNGAPATYALSLNRPVNTVQPANAIQLVSEPPGSVSATISLNMTGLASYEVTLTDIVGDGRARIVLPEGFFVDPAGNQSAARASAWRTFDTFKPVIHIDAPVPAATPGGEIVFPFSIEAAGKLSSPSVSIITTGQVIASLSVRALPAVGNFEYFEAIVSNASGQGTVTVRVNGNSVSDLAGNLADTVTSEDVVTINQYCLNIEVVGLGTTNPAPGGYAPVPNTKLDIVATPQDGETFSFWRVNGSIVTTPTLHLTMTRNYKLEANFSNSSTHSLDLNENHRIELQELLRCIQFFNSSAFHCSTLGESEDGYLVGAGGDHSCRPHDADYDPQDWRIDLGELLRIVQFYNVLGYEACPSGEDGFCAVNNARPDL